MASSSSTAPAPGGAEPKDMSFNIQHNALSNPTTVGAVYSNMGSITHQKQLHAAGAPAFRGTATVQPYGDLVKSATIPLLNPSIDTSFNARLPPSGEKHPEWQGSVPDHWMDRASGRYNSRKIVPTAVRNGAPDSFTRNGFSYSYLPYVNTECRKMLQSWVPDAIEGEWKPCRRRLVPPHLRNKETIESCKWTKKPGYAGPKGLGAERPGAKKVELAPARVAYEDEGRDHAFFHPQNSRHELYRATREERAIVREVRDLDKWEKAHLGPGLPMRGIVRVGNQKNS